MTRQRKAAAPEHRKLSVHQVVAYNFRRAREALGWTQAETGEQLAPYLGTRLNQAGVSAIEKTYDSDRRRNIDVAEIVAFARCFQLPLNWFFVPPPGRGADWVEPADDASPGGNLPASALITLALGNPEGWAAVAERLLELAGSDPDETRSALSLALAGVRTNEWEKQIDLRRQALLATTLAGHATPGEQTIAKMAELLVELVKLTPLGFDQLRRTDPDEALRLLARGDQLVQPTLRSRQHAEAPGAPAASGYEDLQPIDVSQVLGIEERRS